MGNETMDEYARLHRNPVNLLLHALTVPLFLLAALAALLCHWLPRGELWWGGGVALAVYALVLQGYGHRLERERGPRRAAGAAVAGFLTEQFATFPRFVFSGGWSRNWRRGWEGLRELPRPTTGPPRKMQ